MKLYLIHLADMFDYYILHGLLDRCYCFWKQDWLYDLHIKFCTKLCLSEWWGEEQCECWYCSKVGYNSIENE